MVKETMYTRALRQAIQRIGSRQSLAARLGVTDGDLIRWLVGEEPPPAAVRDALAQIVEPA